MTTVIYKNTNHGQQLDLEGNLVDVSPKRQTRKPKTPGVVLTERDLKLMEDIHDFGGVLNTIQISLLHFPPDLRKRLTSWGIPKAESAAWMEQYDLGYLNQKIEELRWGVKVDKALKKAKPSKAERKLLEWLTELTADQRQELDAWLAQITAVKPHAWLAQAVPQDTPAPEAFTIRHRFSSEIVSSACKKRLRYLADEGLIQEDEQATRLSDGRQAYLWWLTRKGRQALADYRHVKPSSLDWKQPGSYGLLHIEHRRAINDFRIATQLACQHRGYRILEWIDDNQLKRLLGNEKVELRRLVRDNATGERQEVIETVALKIPDSYCVLDLGEAGVRHCFIEIDRATVTLQASDSSGQKDFAQKLRTLAAFYRSGRYAQMFPAAGSSMWLLTVTTGGQARVDNLRQTTERVIGANNRALDRYFFADMAEIPTWEDYFSTAIFAPIWYRAGQDKRWSLDEQR